MSPDATLTIPSISPRDGKVAAQVPAVDAAGARVAVARARAAQPQWAALPVAARAQAIRGVHKRFLAAAERIVTTLCEETGKPEGEGWTAELVANSDLFRYWAAHAAAFLRPEKISISPINYPGKKAFIEKVPRGVVGVVSPWNYPVAIPLRTIVPALVAGNAVVFKPSSQTPRLGQLFAEIFTAELPAGVFEVVIGRGAVGTAMIEAGVDFLQFTGSVPIGRRIAVECAKRFIPHALELGGKDPALVLADCDLERTAHGVVWGAFTNCGQNCASIERVYVEEAIAEAFTAKVKALTAALVRGRDYGPLTTAEQRSTVAAQVEAARRAGARVETGGAPEPGDGFWYPPTVLTGIRDDMELWTEETFGPLLPIRVVKDAEEAVRLANDNKYGLTASVWTRDLVRGRAIARQLNAGVVTVNNHSFTGALPNAPWGGVKETGYGVTNSHHALAEMVRPRLVLVDKSKAREMWWFPYNDALLQAARALKDMADGQLGALTRLIPAFSKRFK
jgi:acyl-CoA reductase-like NAD-dependent aldehyde dehydrogenase